MAANPPPGPRPGNSQPARPAQAAAAGAKPTAQRPGAKPVAAAKAPMAIDAGASTSTSSRYVRKKTPLWKSPGLWLLLIALGAAGGGGWWYLNLRTLTLVPLDDHRAMEAQPLTVAMEVEKKGIADDDLQFVMLKGPSGAVVDAATGAFTWKPTEAHGPSRHEVQIQAKTKSEPQLTAEVKFAVVVDEDNAAPELAAIADQTLLLDNSRNLSVELKATDSDLPAQSLSYVIVSGGTPGSAIDKKTGVFTFDGSTVKPGQEIAVSLAVRDDQGATSPAVTFRIQVSGSAPPYDRFIQQAAAAGQNWQLIGREPVPLFAVDGKVHTQGNNRLIVYEFATSAAADEAAALVPPDASEISGKRVPFAREAEIFQLDRLIFVYVGTTPLPAPLTTVLGRRLADRTPTVVAAAAPAPMPVSMPTETAVPTPSLEFTALTKLYKDRKLFSPKEYPAIRKVFADRFATSQADVIKQVFGDDATLQAFLEKNVDIREELYTAIDPKFDDVAAALTLFKQLHTQFPAKIKAYYELAIAVAVTWDKERNVYHYENQQNRVHAIMPEPLSGAIDNFKYLTDAESIMQGRVQFLPWEFLVHSVNDTTPVAERIWAVNNYLPKRVMFGECYSQVPYDHEMLRTNDRVCKMDGKLYTLENLRQFGGVCAQQADFAARVGKSLGVPAEYITGEGIQQGLHAWVMWIELKQATAGGIAFTLESHGRYGGDFYYVGLLRDPRTGERITDRQLEMRLQTVGMNVKAKRQAERIMAAYPSIRDELAMPVKEQMSFLSDLLNLCLGNEQGWHALADVSKTATLTRADEKVLVTAVDDLFRTFAKVPDFTWEVFDDLIGFRKEEKDKIALYQRLVQLYDQAKRPDLACQAATVLADKLAAETKQLEACQALMATILRYPTEGRYVPALVDKMDKLSQGLEGADQQMATFYQKFLPTIPKARIDEPSAYCIAMYQKGIDKFRALGLQAEAAAAEVELAKIRAIGQQ